MRINTFTNKGPESLSNIWPNTSKIVISSIYNNFVVNKFTDIIRFVESFIYNKTQSTICLALNIFSRKSQMDFSLEQLFELTVENDKLDTPLTPIISKDNPNALSYLFNNIGEENSKLRPPLSPTIAKTDSRNNMWSLDQISARKQKQELQSFFNELEVITLENLPKSTILEKQIEKFKKINSRLAKFDTSLAPLPPLTRTEENSLKKDLDNCTVYWLEKEFDTFSLLKVLKLDTVELSNMIQNTKKLINPLKGKDFKTKNKVIIHEFFTNLNKLEHIIMDKQICEVYDKRKIDQLNTTYKDYIKSHQHFLKESLNKKPEKIEKLMVKISAKLTKCLADIEHNLC